MINGYNILTQLNNVNECENLKDLSKYVIEFNNLVLYI